MNNDKNKGLADDQTGEFILNESGTSVSIDLDETLVTKTTDDKQEDAANEDENDK